MEFWEKEYVWERNYESGRYARDLWKYIPKKVEESVADTYVDSDGYWIYLADGWMAYGERGCHTIHEWTVADLKDAISQIRKEE